MLNDEIIDMLNKLLTTVKIPMKVKELFLFRPVFHEVPFEDFEPINDVARLTVCDPLCIEFVYEFEGYSFAYHFECTNSKGNFKLKERWIRNSDIFPPDAVGKVVDEVKLTKKSRIDFFSSLLLQILSLKARNQS